MQKMKKEILPTQQFYIGDFGCSHSQLYRYWKNNCNFFGRPHIDYCGYDASEKRINDGRKTLTPRKGDALNYFLVDLSSKFTAQYYHDIIVCMETIEHLPKEKVSILLKNIYRALPSHGYAILSSPNPLKEKGELWAWGDSPKRDHVYEWSFDEIQKPLARAGLKIIAKCGIGPRDIFRTNILHTKQRKRLQKYLPYSIVGNVLCLRDINQCRQWMVLLQKEF
jgi:SAM-dependent methyltransferase